MAQTTSPIEAGATTGLMPEFVSRKDAVKLFGLSIASVDRMIRSQLIKSHLVRLSGSTSGIRLISTDSLREFIQKH